MWIDLFFLFFSQLSISFSCTIHWGVSCGKRFFSPVYLVFCMPSYLDGTLTSIFGKSFAMIRLKIFSVSFTRVSSPSSILVIYKFGLFIVQKLLPIPFLGSFRVGIFFIWAMCFHSFISKICYFLFHFFHFFVFLPLKLLLDIPSFYFKFSFSLAFL